ncbi:hypothetical protein MBLNU457_g0671t1 [Dothideomycetes sp. NU457]
MKLADASPAELVKIIEAKELTIRKLRQKNTRLAQNFREFREESEAFASYMIRDRRLRNRVARVTVTENPGEENESPLAASFVTADDGDSSYSEPFVTEDQDKRYNDLLRYMKTSSDQLNQTLQETRHKNTILWKNLHIMLREALKDAPADTLADPADFTVGLMEGRRGFAMQNRMKVAIFRNVRRGLENGPKATRTEKDALDTDNLFNEAADALSLLRKMSNTRV